MNSTAHFTRADYMSTSADREASAKAHRRYYAQFVTPGVRSLVESRIGKKAILASTDPHMNDIPLAKWDRLHQCLPLEPGIFKKLTGSNSYSLSDSVCIAKEAAKQIKETA